MNTPNVQPEVLFERKEPLGKLIDRALEIIERGDVAVLPTDTVPGIACRADNLDAVKKIFTLKDRPLDQPLPVLLSETSELSNYTDNTSEQLTNLTDIFWPGMLTVIVNQNGKLDKLIGGGTNTIGFRVPNSDILRGITARLGCPLVMTSANPHGIKPSGLHTQLLEWWRHRVPLIILGISTVPADASTVVDLTGETPQILRENFRNASRIRKHLNL